MLTLYISTLRIEPSWNKLYMHKHYEFIKVLLPTDARVFLKGVLKFTLKQLQHVSV
jgi:hypothetical protein